MSSHRPSERALDRLWQALFRPESLEPPADAALTAAAARLGEHVSPALAAYLLEPAAARLGQPLLDPALVREDRLRGRFILAAQRQCLRLVAEAGIEAVTLKGFANAHTIYPEPELRLFGDLDLLIRAADLDRLTRALAARGYRFRPAPAPLWGFIAEGSFAPFVSPDGACNLDIHLQPDSYPINRALDAERLFAASQPLALDGLGVRVPSREHALVLAISNAAKDKFGPYSVRKLIDFHRLLAGHAALDWGEALALLEPGRLMIAARVFLALLARLGARLPELPRPLAEPLGWPRRGEFERLVADYRALFPQPLGWLALARRELLICAAPSAALHLELKRLGGLVRPGSGLPPGWAASS